jgi:hypothetical protein
VKFPPLTHLVGIAFTADGSFDPSVDESLPVTDGRILNTPVAVMH